MIYFLHHIFQATSDIAIVVFAIKVLTNEEPKINKYLIFILFLVLICLYSFCTLNYIYVVIPIYISLIIIKTKQQDNYLYSIGNFILLNSIIIPIFNLIYSFLDHGSVHISYSSFGLVANQETEFFIKMTILLILFCIRKIKIDADENYVNNKEIFMLLSMLSSLTISLAFIISNLYEKIYMNMKEKHHLQLENEKSKLQLAGLLEAQKFVEEMKRFKHDIKNNFIVIDHMMQHQEYQMASNYLHKYIDSFENVQKNIQIDNLVLSAIVNDKVRRYPALGFDVRCFIPDELEIDDVDLAIIIGNLLDNACEYLMFENIYCDILIKVLAISKRDLFIEVMNPCKEESLIMDTLTTRKKDEIEHGYGILNVKNIVFKYDGVFHYEIKDGNFITQILIPQGVSK